MEPRFKPLSYDLIVNNPESNFILGQLISGDLKILALAQCEQDLFSKVRQEALDTVGGHPDAALAPGHPTFDYVRKWDPNWNPKPGMIFQYSLYNSRDDLLFFDEDHHWFEGRHFNHKLQHIPEFFHVYFKYSEIQNVRIQAIAGGGDLGLHRERIIAIPKREHDYKLRFHLPVVTNPGVKFVMDGMEYSMKAGWIYLFNQSCLHDVKNAGSDLRVHLYWDCYLNEYIVSELIGPALHRNAQLSYS